MAIPYAGKAVQFIDHSLAFICFHFTLLHTWHTYIHTNTNTWTTNIISLSSLFFVSTLNLSVINNFSFNTNCLPFLLGFFFHVNLLTFILSMHDVHFVPLIFHAMKEYYNRTKLHSNTNLRLSTKFCWKVCVFELHFNLIPF